MMTDGLSISSSVVPATPIQERQKRVLTATQLHQLADVPPALTWFANIDNPRTRCAYQSDLTEFMTFTGIERPGQFRIVTRAHLLAWRRDLERRALAGAMIRRKLVALSPCRCGSSTCVKPMRCSRIRSRAATRCSPDNASCDGFFGRLKTGLFYLRNWQATTIEQFIQIVDSYIRWCNEQRIKISVGYSVHSNTERASALRHKPVQVLRRPPICTSC
jgi:hypothetical protein